MRLLHIGSGFRPWRRGGLVAYAEDLMEEQARRGHEVSYFFSGRQYPLARRPRLRRWDRHGVAMLEIVNSPLYDHGRQPELEIADPRIERLLARVLAQVQPDIVHVQELAGLPFSVLDVVHRSGTPVVVTLQDYFPLCSTFRLFDSQGQVCLRRDIGADCAATTATDPRDPGLLIEATLAYAAWRLPVLRSLRPGPLKNRVRGGLQRAASAEASRRRRRDPRTAHPATFQRRRDENIAHLNRADCVIAMSRRVAEIYALLGVDPARLLTIHLTLAHIERLTPRRIDAPARPLRFATLAGLESETKGGRLLIDAVRLLSERGAPGSFRLLVLGHVDPRYRKEAEEMPEIEIARHFVPAELDAILDSVDVGLMPSIWEEAYGYAGVEFLAKGVPLIANAIGGMPEYTREGETGWLNGSCSASELADIMARVIDHPEQVADLNSKLRANRGSIVKPLADHAEEMHAVYSELIAAGAGTAP